MPKNAGPIIFRSIGVYRKGHIRIDPRWAKGLTGIEGFSHLLVLSWLDRAHKPDLLLEPKGPLKLPPIGFLATRTPHRPNPIGFTVVRLLGRRGRELRVAGFDGWDGTAILDVKPYTKRESLKKFRIPGWVRRLDALEKDPLRRYGS